MKRMLCIMITIAGLVIIPLFLLLKFPKHPSNVQTRGTILGGAFHYFVINNSGELLAWGDNSWGVLGREDIDYANSFMEAAKIMDNIKTVSTSQFASFAIDDDDSLWAWGTNFKGILDKFTTEYQIPCPIKIMDEVALISSSGTHNLLIMKDGSLWAWGAYYYGQLGDGRYNETLVNGTDKQRDTINFDTQIEKEPTKIMDNVRYALAGGYCSFAIKSDGSLWAWGNNEKGELGDGTTITRLYPVKIMDGVSLVSTGYYAIKNDGSLWSWGPETKTNTSMAQTSLFPEQIMEDVVYASMFYGSQSVAIKKDGSFWTWGKNDFGQLGDGTTINRDEPAKIMDEVIYSSGDFSSTLALKKDGSLWQMGAHGGAYDENPKYIPYRIADNIMLPETITFNVR